MHFYEFIAGVCMCVRVVGASWGEERGDAGAIV